MAKRDRPKHTLKAALEAGEESATTTTPTKTPSDAASDVLQAVLTENIEICAKMLVEHGRYVMPEGSFDEAMESEDIDGLTPRYSTLEGIYKRIPDKNLLNAAMLILVDDFNLYAHDANIDTQEQIAACLIDQSWERAREIWNTHAVKHLVSFSCLVPAVMTYLDEHGEEMSIYADLLFRSDVEVICPEERAIDAAQKLLDRWEVAPEWEKAPRNYLRNITAEDESLSQDEIREIINRETALVGTEWAYDMDAAYGFQADGLVSPKA